MMKKIRAGRIRFELSSIRTTEIALQKLLDQGELRGHAEIEVSREVRRLRLARTSIMQHVDDDQGVAGTR